MNTRKPPHPFLNNQGFTLLEVLIAISLLSLVMVAVLTITDSSEQVKNRVTNEDNNLLQVETAFSRIEWDFNHIYSPLYFSHEMKTQNLTEAQGEAYNNLMSQYSNNQRFKKPSYDALPIPIFSIEDKETLTFFSMSNRRKFRETKQSRYAWVQYALDSIEKDEDIEDSKQTGKALIRKIVADNVFDSEEIRWDKVKSQILLRNVEKIKYEFWNPETKKWVENIDTIKDGKHILKGLKVTLDWLDLNGFKKSFVRIFSPLFPNFTPEDMYKIINQQNNTQTEPLDD